MICRDKERDRETAEAASSAAEHGSTSVTPARQIMRSRSRGFFNGLLASSWPRRNSVL